MFTNLANYGAPPCMDWGEKSATPIFWRWDLESTLLRIWMALDALDPLMAWDFGAQLKLTSNQFRPWKLQQEPKKERPNKTSIFEAKRTQISSCTNHWVLVSNIQGAARVNGHNCSFRDPIAAMETVGQIRQARASLAFRTACSVLICCIISTCLGWAICKMSSEALKRDSLIKRGSGVWGDVFFLDQLGFKIYHNLPLSICWCENQGRVNWPIVR